MLLELLLVLGQSTGASTHRVRIFAEHERHVSSTSIESCIFEWLFCAEANLLYVRNRRIHHAPHINVLAVLVTLVVQRSRAVDRLHCLGHGAQIAPDSSLVAKRPHNNAGVILVTLNHANGSVNDRGLPVWVVGWVVYPANVAESVGF